jgi:L-aspartate oxidase
MARVVHAGGAATGVEVERALVEAVHRSVAVIHENWFALDLVIESGRCRGVVALDEAGRRREVRAAHVLLATGGAGQVFAVTTNPLEATGDGTAMALRAGVAVADLEFVQFHPTALHHPAVPRPLLSEALRGHGALLRDRDGQRFVDELLPRDEVSRAMTSRMLDQDVDHLWLDATALERFDERFPTINARLVEAGLDARTEWLPIAPAAHYFCGGVVTDLDGATALPGLWGAGEVACSGVHGANRLASNSLLEGMVYGFRVVEAVERGKDAPDPTGAMRAVMDEAAVGADVIGGTSLPVPSGIARAAVGAARDGAPVAELRHSLQRAMTNRAGVLRQAASIDQAAADLEAVAEKLPVGHDERDALELRNLHDVALALLAAARVREETRGAHTRVDFPDQDDRFRTRLVLRADRG